MYYTITSSLFLLVVACLSCLYNSYLLKKKVFTGINSDKPEKELTEEETMELANKKTREKTMAKIMEGTLTRNIIFLFYIPLK